jgi:hypothetical protein
MQGKKVFITIIIIIIIIILGLGTKALKAVTGWACVYDRNTRKACRILIGKPLEELSLQ